MKKITITWYEIFIRITCPLLVSLIFFTRAIYFAGFDNMIPTMGRINAGVVCGLLVLFNMIDMLEWKTRGDKDANNNND